MAMAKRRRKERNNGRKKGVVVIFGVEIPIDEVLERIRVDKVIDGGTIFRDVDLKTLLEKYR